MFYICIKYLEHIDEIVYNIFQYLNMLRSSKPSEKIFLEMKAIQNLDFRFKGTQLVFLISYIL